MTQVRKNWISINVRRQRRGVWRLLSGGIVLYCVYCLSCRLWKELNVNARHEPHDVEGIDGSSIFDRCSYPSISENARLPIIDATRRCTYFRPTRYFSHKDLPGYRHGQLLNDTHTTNLAVQLNNWVEGLAGPRMKSARPPLPAYKSATAFPCPKSGSSTIRELFVHHLAVPKNLTADRGDWNIRRVGPVDGEFCRQLQRRQMERRGRAAMSEDVVLAVVRDPVTRFFAALAEFISQVRSARCRACKLYFQPCLYPNATHEDLRKFAPIRDIVMCTINSIRKHGFFDEHIIPQSFYITKPLITADPVCDIEIAVFPMDQLDTIVVEGFGIQKLRKNDRSKKKTQVGDGFRDLIEQMDSLLQHASIDKEVICALCSLYEVDINMMRYLEFPIKYCTDYCVT